MKKSRKMFAVILAVCVMIMMFGTMAFAGSNNASGTYNGESLYLYAECTRTAAVSKMSSTGSSMITAAGTVRYTSKYNTGTSGTVYSTNISKSGTTLVSAPYYPEDAYYNVSITAWGNVNGVKKLGNIAAYSGLTR